MTDQASTSTEVQAGTRPKLRARTAALHARLDRIIEASCLGEPLHLRRLLDLHHAALGVIVPALECAGAARLFPGWEGRTRLLALEADLADLRADPQRRLSIGGLFRSEQEVWGALYAIEGSRLGNQVLLRKIAERGNGVERRATRFLAHRPEEEVAWPRFIIQLEALDYRGEDFEAVSRGAERVFNVYLLAAEWCLGPERQ